MRWSDRETHVRRLLEAFFVSFSDDLLLALTIMSADDGAGTPGSSRLDIAYDDMRANGWEPELCFEPMLPRVYEIMLPSLDAKLNLVNSGRRHAAILRYCHAHQINCIHVDIVRRKIKLLTAILTKLLDINGILDKKTTL